MDLEGLFRFSTENALELIISFDENGVITYANPTAEQQLEFEEGLCGHLIKDIFPGEFQSEDEKSDFLKEIDKPLRVMSAYRKNKTCFPVKGRLYLYHEQGEKKQYVCIVYNFSIENLLEKKASQAGQEAEEAQKVKSEFVANVTHELRTPVNGILGNTRELLTMEKDPDKRKLLELIEHGCRDMNELINSILDFSKLEAGKFTLEPRKFDFRDMMEYVKGNHSSRIIEKGLDFSVSISPKIPTYVIGDKLRIVQILNNLISNAYKFTSVGGIHVEVIKTAQLGNRIELFFMVIDSGIGIQKEKQDKLFQSFVQADASISRKYGGTGLGLNICKQLVELMGGSIHVESEYTKGSTFSFHIWLELPKEDLVTEGSAEESVDVDTQSLLKKLQNITEDKVSKKIWEYGTAENREEIKKKMSKLILCVEMENWEKAEMFAESVKKLLEEAPREIKSAGLRLKMSVQKGDYGKTVEAFELLQSMIMDHGGR
ncbi:MAG: ATP-binding protein [Lachnospiraceae bacterium]